MRNKKNIISLSSTEFADVVVNVLLAFSHAVIIAPKKALLFIGKVPIFFLFLHENICCGTY